MRLLSLGLKLPVAVGLDWRIPREASEVKDAPRRFERKLHGRVKGLDGDIAFGEDKGDGDASAKAYCGAAVVAMVAPDAFVYHEIPTAEGDEPLVWVCGVGRGVPTPGFDALVSVAEARAKYTEFVSFNHAAQVYGTLPDARDTLQGLLERVPPKELKNAQMVRAGISIGKVLAVILIPVVVVAVGLGYQQFERAREREQLTHKAMIERELAAAVKKQRLAELRADFQANVAAKRREVEVQPDAMLTVDAWVGMLSTKVPLSVKGYQPIGAKCAKAGCTVQWRAALQSLPLHMLELPGRAISNEVNTPSTLLELQPMPAGVRDRVDATFKLELMSFAKASGTLMTVTIKGEPQFVRVEPPKELQELGDTGVSIAKVGRFQASFSNLVAVREFARWVQPRAVSIDTMEAVAFHPSGGAPAYQVEGSYVLADDPK